MTKTLQQKSEEKSRRSTLCKRQVRVHVPFADFRLYQTAKKFNKPYKQFLIDHGRKWMKRLA